MPQDQELFDMADVTYEFYQDKKRKHVELKLESNEPFNMLKIYLSLKMIAEKMEAELGIQAEHPREH